MATPYKTFADTDSEVEGLYVIQIMSSDRPGLFLQWTFIIQNVTFIWFHDSSLDEAVTTINGPSRFFRPDIYLQLYCIDWLVVFTLRLEIPSLAG